MKYINKLLNNFGYYKISQLTIGAHCGCCGAWMPDAIVENDGWEWSLCKKCIDS